MKVLKHHTSLKKMSKQEDAFVEASPAERISMMWELTAELWSLTDSKHADRRLQRDVAALTRAQGFPQGDS